MKKFIRPSRPEWRKLCTRPKQERENVSVVVRDILNDVERRGDAALAEYSARFDGRAVDIATPDPFGVASEDLARLSKKVPQDVRDAFATAIGNIRAFHQAQVGPERSAEVETLPGVRCYRRAVPIQRVGLYVPGGTAPLFSTLIMLAVPAQVAGCDEIIVLTPPGREEPIAPVIAAACVALGIDRVFAVGGAQAIAALAFGTESIPAVDKICGPGNGYVNEAKLQVAARGVSIDLPAGPSEVFVIADEGADPAVVAADLLAQAEHGPDSQVVLATPDSQLAEDVMNEVERQLRLLPREAAARTSIERSCAVVFDSLDECLEFSNEYAPEHLILSVREPAELAGQVRNAGSVFLGYMTAEAFGDYASGTNHVLPTNGAARGYSGISVDSFIKKITYQEVSPIGWAALTPVVVAMARAEGLEAHAQAVLVRAPITEKV